MKIRISFFDKYSYPKNFIEKYPNVKIHGAYNVVTKDVILKLTLNLKRIYQFPTKRWSPTLVHNDFKIKTLSYGKMYDIEIDEADLYRMKLEYNDSDFCIIRVCTFRCDSIRDFIDDKLEITNHEVKTYMLGIKKGNKEGIYHSKTSKNKISFYRKYLMNFIRI